MNARLTDCELCGRWSSNINMGACPSCIAKYRGAGLSATVQHGSITPVNSDEIALETPPYTRELARRVVAAMNDIGYMPPQQVVEDIIGEALFQAAMDIRTGQADAVLEYIGTLSGIGGQAVTFIPDDYVLPGGEGVAR